MTGRERALSFGLALLVPLGCGLLLWAWLPGVVALGAALGQAAAVPLAARIAPGRLPRLLSPAAVAWPAQASLLWAVAGWPLGERELVLGLGALVGTVCVLRARALPRPASVAAAIFGLALPALAPPTLVWRDGRRTVRELPAISPGAIAQWDGERGRAEFVHLSDLHVTDGRARTLGGRVPGNRLLPAYVQRVEAIVPRAVFVTGDITDSGEPTEWREARAYLRRLGDGRPVLLAPGNHDLRTAYGRTPRGAARDRALRLVAFLEAQAEMAAGVQTADGRSLARLLEAPRAGTVRGRRGALGLGTPDGLWARLFKSSADRAYSEDAVRYMRTAEALGPSLAAAFPLTWRSPDGSLRAFVLNSSASDESHLGRAAIGTHGAAQIDRLAAQLEGASADANLRAVVILTHHAFARPARMGFDSRTVLEFGLEKLRPAESRHVFHVLRTARARRPDVAWAVCYGHRHSRGYGDLGGLRMIEAPNLRPPGSENRGLWVGERAAGGWHVRWAPIEPSAAVVADASSRRAPVDHRNEAP